MSWEDILKKVNIDMGDALDACCEIARGETIEVFQDYWEDYMSPSLKHPSGRTREIITFDRFADDIENRPCESLENMLIGMTSEEEFKILPAPMLARLKAISDNWDKCKRGADKLKEGLKVKPEGFNPEEPYARYKKWPQAPIRRN